MKITLAKVNRYYGAILSVSSVQADFKTAHALMMAKKEFAPHAQFYEAEERKLIEEYAVKDENGECIHDGRFTLPGAVVAEKFKAKKDELEAVEVDVELKETELGNLPQISANDLEVLSEIFEFKV